MITLFQLSVQCMENQRGLHGQIVYDDVSYLIHLQPQAEPEDDEGIVIDTEEVQARNYTMCI